MTELPAGWIWATVGELCDINPRHFDDMPDDDELVSKVPMAAVEADSGRMDPSELVEYGSVKEKSLTPFQENDVLFAKVTPCMENGKIALARGLRKGRAMGSTELFALRSLGAIEPSYLMYFLLQRSVRKEAERVMTGAVGLRRVPRAFLSSLRIPLPPLAEQRRIVVTLERSIARISTGQAGFSIIDARLSMLIGAVLERFFNEESPIGSGEFRLRPLSEVAVVHGGILKSPKRRPLVNRYPFLRVANVLRGRLDLDDVHDIELFDGELERYALRDGDLLVVEGNGSADQIGRAALWRGDIENCVHQNHLIRVRPDAELLPDYLELVWNSPSVSGRVQSVASSTSGLHTLSTSKVKSVLLPVPSSLETQARIVSEVSQWQMRVASLRATRSWVNFQVSSLYTALFIAAFSGSLAPQDPDDEPASMLLERTGAARTMVKQRRRSPRARGSGEIDL